MEIDDHWISYVQGAFILANTFGPDVAHGRTFVPPEGEAAVTAAFDALTQIMNTPPQLSLEGAGILAQTGRELWSILRAAADSDTRSAAEATNDLLNRTNPRPRMVQHGPAANWHLHFSTLSDDEGMLWSTNLAIATAMFLGSTDFSRAGTCQAPNCHRVFLDITRNQSQQFCSTRCQDRVKAAAHRQRRSTRTATASRT